MHERPYTEEIVHAIQRALESHPHAVPERVRVRVGEVYHLVPDSVRTHFDSLTQGTPLSGIELDLVEEPLRVVCRSCGHTGGVEDHHMPICESCGSLSVKASAGSSIVVEEITLHEADITPHSHHD